MGTKLFPIKLCHISFFLLCITLVVPQLFRHATGSLSGTNSGQDGRAMGESAAEGSKCHHKGNRIEQWTSSLPLPQMNFVTSGKGIHSDLSSSSGKMKDTAGQILYNTNIPQPMPPPSDHFLGQDRGYCGSSYQLLAHVIPGRLQCTPVSFTAKSD